MGQQFEVSLFWDETKTEMKPQPFHSIHLKFLLCNGCGRANMLWYMCSRGKGLAFKFWPACSTIYLFPESEDVPAVPLSDPRNDTRSEITPGYTSSGLYYKLFGLGSKEKVAQNFEVEVSKRTAGMSMHGPWI